MRMCRNTNSKTDEILDMKNKVILAIVSLMLGCMTIQAQNPNANRKFDPARFEAELEQFITTSAGLSPNEASAFFPLYREMQKKQRSLFDQLRRRAHVDVNDDEACKNAIQERDRLDVQIKELQQTYHEKFMKVLPARKVFSIIKAEENFHRQAFRRAAKHDRGK